MCESDGGCANRESGCVNLELREKIKRRECILKMS